MNGLLESVGRAIELATGAHVLIGFFIVIGGSIVVLIETAQQIRDRRRQMTSATQVNIIVDNVHVHVHVPVSDLEPADEARPALPARPPFSGRGGAPARRGVPGPSR